MRKLLIAFCSLLPVHPGLAAPAAGIPWRGSLRDASAQAQSAKKPLLLFLHADYCVWCKVMERTSLQDSRVRLLAGQYVPCRLNGEREGKAAVKQYQVIEYPCVVTAGAEGKLISKTMGMTDADVCSHTLSADLPADVPAQLAAECATHPDDQDAIATLVVLHAERGEVGTAAGWRSRLVPANAPADDVAAASHALGMAYFAQGDTAEATDELRNAAAAATDPREVVALHLLIADCYLRLHRKTEAIAELDAIRHFRPATKDEKNAAKQKEEHLSPGE